MCLDSTTNNTPTSDRDEQSALDSETKLDEDLQTRTSELIEQINGINLRILWDTTSDAENQIFSSYLSWFKTQMDLIEMGRPHHQQNSSNYTVRIFQYNIHEERKEN